MDMDRQKRLASRSALLAILIWTIFEEESMIEVVIAMAIFLFLDWIIPERYERNFMTFWVLIFVGIPGWMFMDNVVEIPVWAVWAWLVFSLAAGILFPFPSLRWFSCSSSH